MTKQSKHLQRAIECLSKIEDKNSRVEIQLIREALTSLHHELEKRVENVKISV